MKQVKRCQVPKEYQKDYKKIAKEFLGVVLVDCLFVLMIGLAIIYS